MYSTNGAESPRYQGVVFKMAPPAASGKRCGKKLLF
jgi:hypothetical protein